jgi:Fe-S cluster assembly protein SufD
MDALVQRTAAEAAWLEGGDPSPSLAWLESERRAATEAFARSGLPHRRLEDWKWTDLRRLVDGAYPPERPGRGDEALIDALAARSPFAALAATRLVFVNGRFDAARSRIAGEGAIEVHPFAAGNRPSWLSIARRPDDAIDALNIAHVSDGAAVRVRAGAKAAGALELCFLSAPGSAATLTNRNLVVLEEGSALTLFETHLGDGAYVANSTTEVRLGRGARLERVKVGCDGGKAIHLANLVARLGEGADFRDFTLTMGPRLTRQQGFVTFAGEHAAARIAGSYLIAGRQHADTRLVVDHAVPHGASRELFKCVMDGEARGVFQGKVIVRPGAQKTDGKQSSHGLLLSPTAEFDTKPELEIFADDVVCGHGATAGEIDEDQLFYLRARGIAEAEAKSLLVAAFIGEAIEVVENEAAREVLSDIAAGWLAGHGEAGT